MNVGIDIGYSSTKVVSSDTRKSFQSIIGSSDTPRFNLSQNTEGTISFTANTRLKLNGEKFVFGNVAIDQSISTTRREDRNWIRTQDYYKLLIASLWLLYDTPRNNAVFNVCTGLPVMYFTDKPLLIDLFTGKHTFSFNDEPEIDITIENVRVIPQPFGTAFDVCLSEDGNISDSIIATGNIGIVDIGGKTTNILSIKKLGENPKETTGINVGGWDAIRALGVILRSKFPDLELRDIDIAQALVDKYVFYFGEKHLILGDIEQVSTIIAHQIEAEITRIWGTGAKMDKIIFTGGGSILVGQYFTSLYKNAVVVSDNIYANANGYLKFANRTFGNS